MYRELYGQLEDCKDYVEDKNHKTFAWMEYPFSLIFENKTNYHLKIWKKRKIGVSEIKLDSKQTVEIIFNDWNEENLKVEAIDVPLCCYFKIQSGIMIEREWIEKKKEIKEYLVPIFHMGKIELIISENPEPNLGKVPQYTIKPLKLKKFDTMEVLVKNCTEYDLLFLMGDNVLAKSKSGEEKKIILPRNRTVYIDTELEEIVYEPYFSNDFEKRKVLRVNGCCLEFEYARVAKQHNMYGPILEEPYIRFLYVDCKEEKKLTEMKIRCWTIDCRLE